jgi:hypothetical protein
MPFRHNPLGRVVAGPGVLGVLVSKGLPVEAA